MRAVLTAAVLAMTAAAPALAQEAAKPPAAISTATANPADVGSVDAIIAALYDVISGEAGKARDWDRFRSLFHPGATMIPTGMAKDGAVRVSIVTPEQYIERNAKMMTEHGFFERELARRTESFGAVTQVLSTYETLAAKTDAKPMARGVNSIQLLNDGKRWWVASIAWAAETPALPLPEKYLK